MSSACCSNRPRQPARRMDIGKPPRDGKRHRNRQVREEGFSLSDIAIDEFGAIVVAGVAINIQHAMPPIEKAADDESSNSPTAAVTAMRRDEDIGRVPNVIAT